MRHLIPTAAAVAVALLAACTETPTDPNTGRVPADHPSLSATLPGTTASITTGSCSLISPTTGEVRCSYDIANPDQVLLNIYPDAQLGVDYQCLNASTGKVQSSGTSVRGVYASIEGVTAANPTGTNVQLSTATLPNHYTRNYTKYNTCKGKQTLVITNYSLLYWEIWVDNWYSGQPNEDYRFTCLGSDASHGCATDLID